MTNNRPEVSKPANSVARQVDRLSPGEYILRLTKPFKRFENWRLEIMQTKHVKTIEDNDEE